MLGESHYLLDHGPQRRLTITKRNYLCPHPLGMPAAAILRPALTGSIVAISFAGAVCVLAVGWEAYVVGLLMLTSPRPVHASYVLIYYSSEPVLTLTSASQRPVLPMTVSLLYNEITLNARRQMVASLCQCGLLCRQLSSPAVQTY